MTSLRGIAWCGFADFGLQLCLLFFLALCAEELRRQPIATPVLDLRLPDLAGSEPGEAPEHRPLLVEWDGVTVAVDGQRIGGSDDPGVFVALQRRVHGEPERPLRLLLPEGPCARLLAALGARDVQFATAGR